MTTQNINIADLKKISNKIKSDIDNKVSVEPSERLRQVAEQITEAPNFSWKQFISITKISEHTLRSWLSGNVSQPQKSTLEAIRRYLRVSDDMLSDYMRGKVTITELWESRNTDMGYSLSLAEISNAIAPLTDIEKLKLISQISKMLQNKKTKELEESSKVDDPDYIEINQSSALRLKSILEASLIYAKKTREDLLDAGVDGALLESIYNNFEDGKAYTRDCFLTLTPYLAIPLGWMGEVPMLDPSCQFNDDLDSLLLEINQ